MYFEAVGLAFEYEPQGYRLSRGAYLPDFYLWQVRTFVEVKPVPFLDEERKKVEELVELTDRDCLLLVGPPEPRLYELYTGYHEHPYCEAGIDGTYVGENRLFKCGGAVGDAYGGDDVARAVNAARSARFGRVA